MMLPDAFTWTYRMQVIALAARNRVPAVYQYGHFAREGGLVSYGIDPEDVYRRTATYGTASSMVSSRPTCRCSYQLSSNWWLTAGLRRRSG
jgi:hypothetical protein